MDPPASYYGRLDRTNPLIGAFERETQSFLSLMKRRDNRTARAKGIQILLEIWGKYKHRLPPEFYQERMLFIADVLSGIKLYQLALCQGYRLHLQQFSSVEITEVTDVDHFMSCFFPEGLDTDHHTLTMKGCCLCVFEQEKSRGVFSQEGLSKLLHVLSFIRIMMQALQQHEHLSWHLYNGSLQIYNICRFLMTKNYSAQAQEFLLWASISLELSADLMTVQHLPWIVTLYCAVCCCYYDNQAAVQAEAFAKRAQEKINELAQLDELSGVPASRETQRAYREASIKLAVMVFKKAVYDARRKPKDTSRSKTKGSQRDTPNTWPRNVTECMLKDTFEGRAAQFLGVVEALWDSSRRPLQASLTEEPQLREAVLELLAAGTTLLSGEEKIHILSAVKFIKLLLVYKQPDAFAELSRQMLQVLPDVEGRPFRKAELELTLLHSFNALQCSQRSQEDNSSHERQKSGAFMSDEVIALVDTLHKSVCGSALHLYVCVCVCVWDLQPDRDLLLDVVLFLWRRVKAVTPESKPHTVKPDHNHKAAFACDLVTADCIMMAEMTHRLAQQLESSTDRRKQTRAPVSSEAGGDAVKPESLLCFLQSSNADLLKRACEVVQRGLDALSRALDVLQPHDGSVVTDSAFLQKFKLTSASSSRVSSFEMEAGERKKEMETKVDWDIKSSYSSQSKRASLLITDLRLELIIIHHRAALKLLQLNQVVTESQLFDGIRKNKMSKAVLLIQKASLVHDHRETYHSSTTKKLLEEASALIEKAGLEERKLCISTNKTANGRKETGMKEHKPNPPPPPILLSHTDRSFTLATAPYHAEGQVSWYRIFGRVADGVNQKVRLGDYGLPGTGSLIPRGSGQCVLRVEGLEPNHKYMFAVAAYDSEGKLLGNAIGDSTIPLLASAPLPLLSTWAHLSQVAFQTEQYAVAKRACGELWSHFTFSRSGAYSGQDGLARTKLRVQTLQRSSPLLRQSFLASIFMETEINAQQGSLHCDSFSDSGPFIWNQEARLAECERMLVAMELAMWLNDGGAAVQAVVACYGLLAPLIFHQIVCDSVVQVLTKSLFVLEESSAFLRHKSNANTAASHMHMIACITYYLSKVLRVLRQHRGASQVIICGRKLLTEVCEAHLKAGTLGNQAEGVTTPVASISQPSELSDSEDPVALYDLITSRPLNSAYQNLMRLRRKAYFIEFAALLLQRTIEEDHPDLVIKWGQNIFEFLYRRDKDVEQNVKALDRKRRDDQALKGKERLKNTNMSAQSQTSKRAKQKKQQDDKEMQAVENVLSVMSSLLCRQQQRLQLRKLNRDERVWRSQLNFSLAQAHLALLYKGLEQLLHGAAVLQHRYSQLSPLSLSLASSGVLMLRRIHQLSPASAVVPVKRRGAGRDEDDDSDTEESDEGSDDSQCHTHRHAAASLLDSLHSTALHFRRAMVLAHRGSHWTALQCVCRSVWDQSCRLSDLVQRSAQVHTPPSITAEQLDSSLTPLLVLAADLLMDMLKRTGLCSVYESEQTGGEELESSLHFSASLDDSTKVDLRWIRTLVLHTLEQLHHRGEWEKLAHLALVFNSYTRERYTSMVTPSLLHAQRRLIDRITACEGPAIPQPHHVKTQRATGKQVTCRSYVDCQLLIGRPPLPKASANLNHSARQTKPTIRNKPPPTNSKSTASIQLQEIQRARALVCVPLDVEDTLSCFCEALERRPYCLQVSQHSRSLLLRLLAHTQPGEFTQSRQGNGRPGRSAGLVEFSPIIMTITNLRPEDLTEEDYRNPYGIYKPPISPDQLPTVAAAYSASIKYLLANNHDSLRVQALHDLGNLHFYSGNTQAAQSHWCKAVDCALQSSGVLSRWDGETFGGGSMKQTLKLAGMWGCLQAAGLAAKLAQYILTSDISQRTKCCLLSAHLFKCVLCCCLAQPQSDLQYVSHSVGGELLPGVDLFSEPHRLHLGTTVTGLSFVCHWLFTAGYHVTLLPMLALHQHFVETLCRDVRRTVEGKILKIRALTELSLFTHAVKEAVQLTRGADILLPHGHISTDTYQPVTTFYSNKSLLDNTQALDELVNCDFAPEVQVLYGSTLCYRFNLARIRLVLALSSTIHGFPVPGLCLSYSSDCVACASVTEHPEKSVHKEEEDTVDIEGSNEKSKESKSLLALDSQTKKLTLENLKFILLEAASSLLTSTSDQATSQPRSEIETLELTIETNLLKADLHLQQGHSALSSRMAAASLELLQTSPVIGGGGGATSADHTPTSQLLDQCDVLSPPPADCPTAVEAFERSGAPLWLRCRLSLVRSLNAHIPGTAIVSGKNGTEETLRVLQEGLSECDLWSDPDTQALLLLERAVLEEERGKTKDDRIALLQEAVSLLSGRTFMPPASSLTLAQASMMLSELRGTQSSTLLKLTQKLLQQQLCSLGQTVELEDGRLCFPPSGLNNIFLPHLPMLAQITMHIGHMMACNALERPVSSESTPRKSPRDSSQTDRRTDSVSPNPCPALGSFHVPKARLNSDVAQAWREARQVLHSALILSRSCACRNTQLEADLLYCRGIAERSLRCFNKVKREDVAQTFLQCIQTTMRHGHNLPMLRLCYLEVALLFLHDWQQTQLRPPALPSLDKRSRWKRLLTSLSRGLSPAEGGRLLFWIFLRGAATVLKATSACAQLLVSAKARGEALSATALNSLPAFAASDLLNTSGAVYRRHQDSAGQSLEEEESFRASGREKVQLTWVHMARYYTQLMSQLQTANTHTACPQTVEFLAVLSGDSKPALRLSQLHHFFCSHMTNYRESCCAPQPAPAELIQLPQVVQLSSRVRTCLGQKEETYLWSKSTKQQLCVQWHRPVLSPAPGHQDTMILLYGHNRHPLSAMTASAMAVMGLQCGLHVIETDRAKEVHAELRKVCVSANVSLSVPANLVCTPDSSDQPLSNKLTEPRNQHVLKLKQEILSGCSSIMDLLKQGSKSEPLTEVPFEVTLKNLCDLERCFDPAGGAIVDGSALTDWILSVLTGSSTSTDKRT
ncbi:cilia- and flagella-associated protein 54 [Genypterus blacodes]|uniref:cilia- and flagella-associated protein 54 n=1 Tax=Genypterus blacodes TaxID=154954 RepID=UPI003F76ED3F